jgi:hypothetical protein
VHRVAPRTRKRRSDRLGRIDSVESTRRSIAFGWRISASILTLARSPGSVYKYPRTLGGINAFCMNDDAAAGESRSNTLD